VSSLTLDGLVKRYAGTTALDDVSLEVRDGEFFTLVGPSGCGKTTTLRCVAGFETPDAGEVLFGGNSVVGVPPEERDVGVVFQQYALFPHMSVAENVAYGLRFADDPPDREERVADLLNLVGLKGFEGREPSALSGGQQQRVALARALAPEPDLLLLDEPMSALDARLRERLRREVREIQTELGVTTIYVTHDQAEALAVSDRVAVMAEGHVEQVGTPEAVYREPATRFVAEFVGENNVFEGVVRDGRVDVEGERFELPAPDGRTTFCVRPEAMQVDGGRNRLTATVEYAEFLGEAVRVGLSWRGHDLVVRTGSVPEREELVVGFDPEDAVVVE